MNSEDNDLEAVGETFKPVLTEKQIERIALEVFALRILEKRELGSYVDLNFFIKAKLDDVIPEDSKTDEPEFINPNIEEPNEDGYTLKIMNTHASARPATYDMQTKAMFHLIERDINCPEPVQTISGEYYELKTFYPEDEEGNRTSEEKRIHLVCLLKYLPGELLTKHPRWDLDLFFEAAKYAGKVTAALRRFDHEVFKHKSRIIWDPRNASHLRKFMHALPNSEKRRLVSDVLDAYEKHVVPNYDRLQPGALHGDLNNENLLYVQDENGIQISAVIDFGDTSRSYSVFDLVVTMMHLMCLDKSDKFLWTGGVILRGFTSQFALNKYELRLLRYMVMMRYATYLTMSAYTCKRYPSNTMYATRWAGTGWPQLHYLWNASREEVEEAWQIRR